MVHLEFVEEIVMVAALVPQMSHSNHGLNQLCSQAQHFDGPRRILPNI